MEKQVGLIIISLLILLVLVYILSHIVFKNNSKFFMEIEKLNCQYLTLFEKFKFRYKVNYVCNALQTYRNNCNRTSIMNYMCGVVRENSDMWYTLYKKVNSNKSLYNKYIEEYEKLKGIYYGQSYDLIKKKLFFISQNQYLKMEDRVCKKALLRPILGLKIKVILSYTSPGKRNHYEKKFIFRNSSVDEVFARLKDRKESELSIDYQRSLMTSGKRYDILRRDGYKCQICGRTQSDGAKLEIDHIIPISKGGKTVDDNLQTLCHECNQGKKAKM